MNICRERYAADQATDLQVGLLLEAVPLAAVRAVDTNLLASANCSQHSRFAQLETLATLADKGNPPEASPVPIPLYISVHKLAAYLTETSNTNRLTANAGVFDPLKSLPSDHLAHVFAGHTHLLAYLPQRQAGVLRDDGGDSKVGRSRYSVALTLRITGAHAGLTPTLDWNTTNRTGTWELAPGQATTLPTARTPGQDTAIDTRREETAPHTQLGPGLTDDMLATGTDAIHANPSAPDLPYQAPQESGSRDQSCSGKCGRSRGAALRLP